MANPSVLWLHDLLGSAHAMTAFLIAMIVISALNVGISLSYITTGQPKPEANMFSAIFWAAIGTWAVILL